MIGAMFGDIVGSKYEFDNIRTKNFDLFSSDSYFTDDTVCTIALMDFLLHSKNRSKEDAVKYLQKWTRKYPNSGYGGRFWQWVWSDKPEPYGSFGNGSAMRISPVAWVANDYDELKELVNTVTEITHNHKEGIKGALVIATCIFMSIRGVNKEEIKEYAIKEYPEIAKFNYEDLRKNYDFYEICQMSVPQAIYCFLISKDFEDCARTTVSIGGDCDTTAAMSCAIAEAYYGTEKKHYDYVYSMLTEEMRKIVEEFDTQFERKEQLKCFDNEKFVFDMYRQMFLPKIKYFGRFLHCFRIERLTRSILFRLSWKDSSAKSDLPPDFHNNFHHIMMEMMRVDDCIESINGKKIDNTFKKENSLLRKTLGRNYKKQNVTAFCNVDTRNPKEFNIKGYLANFERILNKHSKNVENYHHNYPKCKTTVFFVFDQSNNYVQVSDQKDLKKANDKYVVLHNVIMHNCYADKNFIDIIKKCQADYVIWMGFYKPISCNGKTGLPKACIYDVKHIKRKGLEYNYKMFMKV